MKFTKALALLALLLPGMAEAAVLTPQSLTLAGTTPTYNTAATGGDTFQNDGRTYVHVKNGAASPITVTFASLASYSDNALGDLTLSDIAVSVPASGEKVIGFFPPTRFNSNGRVTMTYSSATSVTVAVVKAGKVY